VKLVFADTVYWVALINPKDEWRNQARSATALLREGRIITTDSILTEVLNFLLSMVTKLDGERCQPSNKF
jgi:predicted nucleic acid-binding protein